MTQVVDWGPIAPALWLVGGAVVALLLDVTVPSWRRVGPTMVTLVAVVGAFASALSLVGDEQTAFCLPAVRDGGPAGCSWVVDDVTLVWWVVVLGATALVAALLHPEVAEGDLPAGETCFLLLASATGAVSLAAAGDLVTLVIAMETVSLPVFALVGLRRADRRGAEAALKLFVASVVATAFTLMGISMVYGATGSVVATQVSAAVASGEAVSPVVGVGLVLTLVGLAFKVASVPFQVWVPDTYVGAPIPVAAYLSVVSKAAGLAGLTIVLVRFFPSYGDNWRPVLAAAAALTMTVGNLAALRQRHAVRLLAWSSVAQAGYLLVPLAAGGSGADVGALQSYLLMYALVNVCAFAVVLGASRWGATDVADFTGLYRRNMWLAVALAFALLCLAGLPPGVVGLVAKVVVFQSAVDADLVWLALVMAVNVAIGLVYYLRFLVVLFRPDDLAPAAPRPGGVPDSIDAVIGLTLAAAVVLSVFPGLLFGPVIP
jgi:NADH-quinone oxidoreductase subunit N